MRTVRWPPPPQRQIGWSNWVRTSDLSIIGRMLFQLSYTPVKGSRCQSSSFSGARLPYLPSTDFRTSARQRQFGGRGRTRTYEGVAKGFTVLPLCRSGHSPKN